MSCIAYVVRFIRQNPTFLLWLLVAYLLGHSIEAYAVAPMVQLIMRYPTLLMTPLYFVFRAAFRWEHKRAIRAYLNAKRAATATADQPDLRVLKRVA